jgi:hypothetical protein
MLASGIKTWRLPRNCSYYLKCTVGLELGPIIERCWTKGASASALDLWKELDSMLVEHDPVKQPGLFRNFISLFRFVNSFQWLGVPRSRTTLVMTIGVIVGYVWSRRRKIP